MADKLLEVKGVSKIFRVGGMLRGKKLVAVDNVSLSIDDDKPVILSIVGESGCGKSTLSKAITRLVPVKSGDILFEGKSIFEYSNSERKKYPLNVQMVFQNPYSSLNPKMKIGEILREPLDINTNFSSNKKKSLVSEILADVGLADSCVNLYPHEFSGGQRQRIAIARALILNPKLLIADEPVSALDASIQAQIINLLKDLKHQRDLTILFISHDLNVIRYLADRVGIMYFGKMVEENNTLNIFKIPQADYTKLLLNSAPVLQRG